MRSYSGNKSTYRFFSTHLLPPLPTFRLLTILQNDDTGELKPSQHLGLARLASMSYDRVARLRLEDYDNGPPLRPNTDGGVFGSGPHLRPDLEGHLSGAGRGDESDHLDEDLDRRGGTGVGTGSERRRGRGPGGGKSELVVAYWSYDYRDHPMGHLTRGLLCSHQVRERTTAFLLFETARYSLYTSMKSEYTKLLSDIISWRGVWHSTGIGSGMRWKWNPWKLMRTSCP